MSAEAVHVAVDGGHAVDEGGVGEEAGVEDALVRIAGAVLVVEVVPADAVGRFE